MLVRVDVVHARARRTRRLEGGVVRGALTTAGADMLVAVYPELGLGRICKLHHFGKKCPAVR